MRIRLREQHPPEVLAKLYPAPHQHTRWPDHLLRVQATIAVAKWISSGESESVGLTKCKSGADLSCGDGAILKALDLERKVFGDLAAGYDLCGPIEQTLTPLDPVDIFLCNETLEHLDDPTEVLKTIRLKAHRLCVSVPDGAEIDHGNVEHLWGFDREDFQQLLKECGWEIRTSLYLSFPTWIYRWQIYGCT